VNCAKAPQPIKMSFGMWTRVGPRKHVLDGGAYWRHLANTTGPSICGSDRAFLSNYFDHLLLFPSLLLTLFTGWQKGHLVCWKAVPYPKVLFWNKWKWPT